MKSIMKNYFCMKHSVIHSDTCSFCRDNRPAVEMKPEVAAYIAAILAKRAN